MSERNGFDFDKTLADNDQLNTAFLRAAREAALTHAKFGRSIPEWQNDQVVWITPAEIFARYGFDEFGRPKQA